MTNPTGFYFQVFKDWKIKLDHQIWTGLIKFRDYFNIYSYESNLTVDIGLELFTIEDTCICTNV